MSNPSDHAWSTYRQLQARINAIRDETARAYLDVGVIAREFPDQTFPERGMEALAVEFEKMARGVRIAIESATKHRTTDAA